MKQFSPIDDMPEAVREFVGRRLAEVGGLVLLGGVGLAGVALSTWSIQDPSWNRAVDRPVRNIVGPAGAIASDLVMQLIGLSVVAVLPVVACWGWSLLVRPPARPGQAAPRAARGRLRQRHRARLRAAGHRPLAAAERARRRGGRRRCWRCRAMWSGLPRPRSSSSPWCWPGSRSCR